MRGRAPDLRLAGFAVAAWLAALAALHLTARPALLLGAAAFGGAATAVVLVRARPDRAAAGWIAVAVLLGAGCGAAMTGARLTIREAGPLVALVRAGHSVRVEAVVRDDPRALRGSPGRPPTYLVAVELHEVGAEDARPLTLSARAVVLGQDPGWKGLLPGQRVIAHGKLMPPLPGDLRAAAVSVKDPPELVGRPPWAQRAAGVLRAGLQRACEPLPDDAGGLLPGLVVGDTSRLDPALSDDFRTTGMTHLMAVSGANVRKTGVCRLAR